MFIERLRHYVSSAVKSSKRNHASPLLQYIDRGFLLPSQRLIRLGTAYGGWLIPADAGITSSSICYSAGAGEDISFDCALAERFHCQVRIIDPTPRAIQHFNSLEKAVKSGERFPVNNGKEDCYNITAENFERLRFLPIGLADQDTELKFYLPKNPAHVSCSTVNLQKTEQYFTAQCFRLTSIIQQQGDVSIDLLKIDIEGAEYGVIRDMITSHVLPRLLLIEFDEAHTPLDNDANARIKKHIDDLVRAGMTCIAVEGSNASFIRASQPCGPAFTILDSFNERTSRGRPILCNVGCGSRHHPAWINIDFHGDGQTVLQWDLRQGVPLPDASCDAVYSSHTIEHFDRAGARRFLMECRRVLKPGGILRLVAPDLEGLARSYLECLAAAQRGEEGADARYEWIVVELLDQLVRHQSGGEMRRLWCLPEVPAEDFIAQRVGTEYWRAREHCKGRIVSQTTPIEAVTVGQFRLGGEVHQWMYDRYSLGRLMTKAGFVEVRHCSADSSSIEEFAAYNLDTEPDGTVYKPDSFFMEAQNP
jgi:FkbM family methyltransferase